MNHGEREGLRSCVLLQQLERNDFERTLVCACEHHGRGDVAFQQFEPASSAYAPAVARFETRKSKLRAGRGKVVSHQLAVLEKSFSHLDAHGVAADVFLACIAMSVAEKPGERRVGTGSQRTAENIARRERSHRREDGSSAQALRSFSLLFRVIFRSTRCVA